MIAELDDFGVVPKILCIPSSEREEVSSGTQDSSVRDVSADVSLNPAASTDGTVTPADSRSPSPVDAEKKSMIANKRLSIPPPIPGGKPSAVKVAATLLQLPPISSQNASAESSLPSSRLSVTPLKSSSSSLLPPLGTPRRRSIISVPPVPAPIAVSTKEEEKEEKSPSSTQTFHVPAQRHPSLAAPPIEAPAQSLQAVEETLLAVSSRLAAVAAETQSDTSRSATIRSARSHRSLPPPPPLLKPTPPSISRPSPASVVPTPPLSPLERPSLEFSVKTNESKPYPAFETYRDMVKVVPEKHGYLCRRVINESGNLPKLQTWQMCWAELRGDILCLYEGDPNVTDFKFRKSSTRALTTTRESSGFLGFLSRLAVAAFGGNKNAVAATQRTPENSTGNVSKSNGNPSSDPEATDQNFILYCRRSIQFVIFLQGCQVEMVYKSSKRNYVFRLRTSTMSEFLFANESLESMHDWFDCLQTRIDAFRGLPMRYLSIDATQGGKIRFLESPPPSACVNFDAKADPPKPTVRKLQRKSTLGDKLKCRPAEKDLRERGIIQPAVFGMNLLEWFESQSGQLCLPPVVSKCLDAIERKGLRSEGIYRVSGNVTLMQKLRVLFNEDPYRVNLNDPAVYGHDIDVVAGLFKMYLRELNEPLIPFAMYSDFTRLMGDDETKCVEGMSELILRLPDIHYLVLDSLLRHLRLIAENTAQNKMTLASLSLIFAPNLLRTPTEDMISLGNIGRVHLLVEMMAEHYDKLFTRKLQALDYEMPTSRPTVDNAVSGFRSISSATGHVRRVTRLFRRKS